MNLFWPIKTDALPATDGHPAFKLGEALATKLNAFEGVVATVLNRVQHRIGYRVRNGLLALTGLSFLLYFIALLT